MKNKLKKNMLIIFILTLVIFSGIIIKKSLSKDNLININSLSQEFMDNYFEEISEVSDEEKGNMLIIISSKKIEDSYGAVKIIEAPNNQYFLLYNSNEEKNIALKKFEEDKRIESVEENIIYSLQESDYNSWGIEKVSLDYAITSANSHIENMQPVTVAIIDSGCDLVTFNKYYPGKIAEVYNVLDNSITSVTDMDGHGTHVAGIIAEGTPSNVRILPIKATEGVALYNSDVIKAINYVVYYEKADVINMSFSDPYTAGNAASENRLALEQALESAKSKNIINVAAAGNSNTSELEYPASFDNTISIASVDSELNKASSSNYGEKISFTAPGVDISSLASKELNMNSDYVYKSGTSMATPHASAAVAILKGYNKDLTLTNVIDILKDNAIDLGDEGWDQYYGYGLISLKNIQFCDGTYCDELGIYKNLDKSISSIETDSINLTSYNYYSLTNILGSEVTVFYEDGTNEKIMIDKLPNVEVLNYDPYILESQTVTIKSDIITFNIEVTNPNNYESGWEYNVLDDGNIEITGYKDHGLNIDKLYIPETIDSKHVVSFADNFKFSESGEDIEYYKYLYLPSSFARIGNYSLSDTNIKYVYGLDNKIEVGAHAFENSLIEIINVPIIKIEDYSFRNCFNLISINIWSENNGEDLDVGNYAFYNCEKLASVRIVNESDGNMIGNIGDYAFYNCISLSYFDLKIGSGIGEYAFYNTFLLNDIDLYHINFVGQYAFYSSGIRNGNFSINLDIINQSAFENCKNLKDVSFMGKRIESKAFWNSSVEKIYISDNVAYISEDAFAYNPIKSSSGLNEGTGDYKIVPGLGIIESSTNKLVVGFAGHPQIAEDIVEIGDYAFAGNSNLNSIIIPANVTKIGDHSFEDCYQLSDVYMLGDSIQFGDDTFKTENQNSNIYIYVYKDSSIKQYVISKNLNYRHIVPDDLVVVSHKNTYAVFSQVNSSDLTVRLVFHEETDREEEIEMIDHDASISSLPYFKYEVSYQTENSHSFQFGDTYFIVEAKDSLGHLLTHNINVSVEKAIPEFVVPSEINAVLGERLSDIELPSGFEWMDGNQTIDEYGEFTYKARYVPTDVVNYQIVDNIDITVVACDKLIVIPEIAVENLIYDGSNIIPKSLINVSNLEKSEYSIVSAVSLSQNAGITTAIIRLKLDDYKFKKYSFSNGKQEKDFAVDFEILKSGMHIEDNSQDSTVIYDGNRHSVNLNIKYPKNAKLKYMDENDEYTLDDIPKYIEPGTYSIKYKVYINDNYTEYFGQKTLTINAAPTNPDINNYEIEGNIIKGISLNTSVSDLDLGLSDSYTVKIKNKANEEKEGLIGTGDRIEIYHNNTLVNSYYAVIKGDINGDGLLKLKDLLTVKNYILKYGDVRNEFDNTEHLFAAADYSSDGKISLKDFAQMKIDFLSH